MIRPALWTLALLVALAAIHSTPVAAAEPSVFCTFAETGLPISLVCDGVFLDQGGESVQQDGGTLCVLDADQGGLPVGSGAVDSDPFTVTAWQEDAAHDLPGAECGHAISFLYSAADEVYEIVGSVTYTEGSGFFCSASVIRFTVHFQLPEPSGACCSPSGTCAFLTAEDCAAAGGDWHGPETICSPQLCTVPMGACCSDGGSCQMLTEAACASPAVWHGSWTTCSPNPCPGAAVGACCLSDGSCATMTESACADQAGSSFHGGSCSPGLCESFCSPTETGLPLSFICDGVYIDEGLGSEQQDGGTLCILDLDQDGLAVGTAGVDMDPFSLTAWQKDAAHGLPGAECGHRIGYIYRAPNQTSYTMVSSVVYTEGTSTFCGGSVTRFTVHFAAPEYSGACCAADGTCALLLAADCATAGGDWQGAGTTCTPGLCAIPARACCLDGGSCQILTEAACVSPGVWHGSWTTCSPNPCPGAAVGACCLSDGTCATMTESACADQAGSSFHGGSCSPGLCESFCSPTETGLPLSFICDGVYIDGASESEQQDGGTLCILDLDQDGLAVGTAGVDMDPFSLTAWQEDTGHGLPGAECGHQIGYIYRAPDQTLYTVVSSAVYSAGTSTFCGGSVTRFTVHFAAPEFTGACCAANGTCALLLAADCAAAGGDWYGAGTACTPGLCTVAARACCSGDGACQILTEAACVSPGVWHGSWTTCSPNPCPGSAEGACCFTGGTCAVLTSTACAEALGTFYADPGACSAGRCTAPGACCLSNGSCVFQSEADCATHSGSRFLGGSCSPYPCGNFCVPVETGLALTFICDGVFVDSGSGMEQQGSGSLCILDQDQDGLAVGTAEVDMDPFALTAWQQDLAHGLPGADCGHQIGFIYRAPGGVMYDTPSSVDYSMGSGQFCGGAATRLRVYFQVAGVTGACCSPAGLCALTSAADCAAAGGAWYGAGTACTPALCTAPVRACCDEAGACQLLAEDACVGTSVWHGGWTSCLPNACLSGTTGACCYLGSCYLVSAQACTEALGTWLGEGTSCSGNPCSGGATGACCQLDGSCELQTGANCVNGLFRGTGTVCSPQQCGQPLGACCYSGTNCAITAAGDCEAALWHSNAPCNPNPCLVPVERSTWGGIKARYLEGR